MGAPLCTIVASQSQIDPTSAKRNTAKKYKCLVSGCKVRASFCNIGELPNYCEAHKQIGSVNLINPTNRLCGKRKGKPSTVQTKLVSFLTRGSVKGSQPSSQSQLLHTKAPDPAARQTSETTQLEIHGKTTDSEETELESPALIPLGNRS